MGGKVLKNLTLKGGKVSKNSSGRGPYVPETDTQAVTALGAIPEENRWYFWDGTSKPRSAVGVYQKSLAKVFEASGVPRAYPHLFRHTLATDLLPKGVSLQTVSTLLGHSSTKMTERRYSHWIKGRQEKLEDELKNSWSHSSQ
jgi:integrase